MAFESVIARVRRRGRGRPRTRLGRDLGDKANSSRGIDAHLRRRGITTTIPEPADQQANRARLSGGQRARVALARALIVNPAVLVLDETTAALDGPGETTVTDALRAQGRTTLIVTHRAGTARRADRVALLDDGQIAETGTFTELSGPGRPLTTLLAQQAP